MFYVDKSEGIGTAYIYNIFLNYCYKDSNFYIFELCSLTVRRCGQILGVLHLSCTHLSSVNCHLLYMMSSCEEQWF